jgi:hypothetical protein
VPTTELFFFHSKAGEEPPPPAVAVKLTSVPWQTAPEGVALTLTEGVTTPLTDTNKEEEETVAGEAQAALEVNIHLRLSPSASELSE